MANLQRLAAADVAGACSAADQAALEDLQAQKAAVAADRDAKVISYTVCVTHTSGSRWASSSMGGRGNKYLHSMLLYAFRWSKVYDQSLRQYNGP